MLIIEVLSVVTSYSMYILFKQVKAKVMAYTFSTSLLLLGGWFIHTRINSKAMPTNDTNYSYHIYL